MRLKIISINSAVKAINKARVSGKLSLVAVIKLNLLKYYLEFTKINIDNGLEDYKDKYQKVLNKYNGLLYSCPDIICDIKERDCGTKIYESVTTISNPYNPQLPIVTTPIDPEPINLPPTIGDNTITVNNNVTTVLTIDMFTIDTNTAYSDPEGDLLDAIRIDKINSTNQGIFYVSGIVIVEEQIITREQIIAGEFTHMGADINTIGSDSFDFSARDEGSLIWVQ